MKLIMKTCLFLLLPVIAPSNTRAESPAQGTHSHKITSNWEEIFLEAEQIRQKCGNSGKVIMAFDLDNTLLRADELLGTEEWYDWQSKLLSSKDPAALRFRACETEDALLQVDALIKEEIRMRTTEANLPALLHVAQNKGIETIVLTSRGANEENGTLVDLRGNNMDFNRSTMRNTPGGEFLPYDLGKPESAGFSSEEISMLKLISPWPVKFTNGVFLTGGLNKGAMMRTLLHRTGSNVCGIVFIDNKEKYNQQVHAAFSKNNIRVATFRYAREDSKMDDLFSCVGMRSTYKDPADISVPISTEPSACASKLGDVKAAWEKFQARHHVPRCHGRDILPDGSVEAFLNIGAS